MPIEIRELIIKAVVQPSNQENIDDKNPGTDQESIQTVAIDEILELVKNKNER